MDLAVAICVYLLLRRLVRWQLALLLACVFVTYIYWATPQLSYNTMALAFLTLSAVMGSWVVVLGKGRRYAACAGAALALAIVAYPSLMFIVPFCAVFFVLAQGRRAPAMLAEGAFLHPPGPGGAADRGGGMACIKRLGPGRRMVLIPVGLVMLSFGPRNLVRSWQATLSGASTYHQLGGAPKAVAVAQGVWRFVTWRPYLVVAALLVYLVFRRWPRVGRSLLAALPVALWLAAQRPLVWASGYVLIYALLAPYLYLFIPMRAA